MLPISQTVSPFLKALQSGASIGVTTDGMWYEKGIIRRIVDIFKGIFFGYDESYENAKNLAASLTSVTKVTSDQIRGLSQPATWNPEALATVVQAVKATLQRKVKKEEEQIEALKIKRDALKTSLPASSPRTPIVELNKKICNPESWGYRFAAANLDRACLMHRYLGMDQRAIDATTAEREDIDWLRGELLAWQKEQFPHVEYLSEDGSGDFSEALLEQCPTFDDFYQRVQASPSLLTQCASQSTSIPKDADLSSPNVKRHLRATFLSWQKNHAVKEKIRHCCRYTGFIAAARSNRALLDMCFQSVFKSMPDEFTNAIDIFLQAPQIQEQLRKTFLDKRIREVANRGLRFVQYAQEAQGKPIKGVHLLIDGEYQPITDETAQVRVARGVNKTVAQVFEEFEAQNFRFIELEYLQDTGITQFDGRLLKFDMDKPEWWKELPVIKRMTREQIEDAYDVNFQEGHAFFAIRASRTTPDLNGADNHGWSDLLIPLPDGTFNCLSLGKFSNWFPVTLMETFNHVFHTHEANVTVLDTNSFMSSRDRTAVPLPPITKEQFPEIMKNLKEEFLRSRRGELIFQAQGDNCASWVRHFIQRNWPGLDIEPYQTPFQDLTLPTIFMPLIWTRNFFPNDAMWHWFRRSFCSLFGALSYHQMPQSAGEPRKIRLLDNHDWSRGILQIPSRLWIERDRVLARVNDYMQGQLAARGIKQQAPIEALAHCPVHLDGHHDLHQSEHHQARFPACHPLSAPIIAPVAQSACYQ